MPSTGLRHGCVVVVAHLAQPAPVLGIVVVQAEALQLSLVPRVVVSHGAGCEALSTVMVRGRARLVDTHAQRILAQHAWPEPALMRCPVPTLLPCAAVSVCGLLTACAS